MLSGAANWEELYEEAPCGYLSCRADGTILRANRTFARFVGRLPEQLAEVRRFEDLLSGPGRIQHATRHLPLLHANGTVLSLALEMLHADGRRLPVLVNSLLHRNAVDGEAELRVTVFDASVHRAYERGLVEARRRAEAAEAEARAALAVAQEAERRKARFLAAMNHEFRTPIGLVVGFSELLEATLDAAHLRDIREAATHLQDLLEDATRYARLDAMGELRPTDLRDLAAAGLRLAGATLARAGVPVTLAADAPELEILADADSAGEAVACLLREAARRVPPGTALRLHCHAITATASIEVHGEVGDPLTGLRAALTETEVYHRGLEGAGLGLAVAERIAHRHGGRLGPGAGGRGVALVFPREAA